MRVLEPPSGWRVVKQCKEGVIYKPADSSVDRDDGDIDRGRDWNAKAESYGVALTNERLLELAKQLHVSPDALRGLGLGWNRHQHVFTFPEKDASGRIIGISTRRPSDGRKLMIRGSRRGLTIPEGLDPSKPLLLPEGASDVAAALTAGLQAVGRPSCMGGIEHLAALLENWTGEVIVLGENDRKADGSWKGRDGAVHTAQSLARRLGRNLGWVLPPEGIKDLRDWLKKELPSLSDAAARTALGEHVLAALRERATLISELTAPEIGGNSDDSPRRSQADLMVELCVDEGIDLFHTSAGVDAESFATIEVDSHLETWSIRSKGFKLWLAERFFRTHRKAPNNDAVQAAVSTIAGMALFQGCEREVAVRVAEFDDAVFVDLCDATWRVVKIMRSGWSILESTDLPVRFVRKKGMTALPEPRRGGNINQLRAFLNVANDDDWRLVVAFIVACFRPRGPFVVLCVNGPPGSAKTTLCLLARALIDPNRAGLRRPPRDDRDVMIAGKNSRLVAYTNLSAMPVWLSDTLCALAYGEGFGTRELYSDDNEILFDAARPVIVNGIEDLMSRSDFADRCLHLVLPRIKDEDRRDDDAILAAFAKVAPGILGAVFDAVSTALRNFASVKLGRLPRMASFARWVVAAEPALPWKRGQFLRAYFQNRDGVNADVIEASSLGRTVLRFMAGRSPWTGTATDLLVALDALAGEKIRKERDWPKAPNALSGKLRRIAPNLHHLGLHVDADRSADRARGRFIELNWERRGPSGCTPADGGDAPAIDGAGRSLDDPMEQDRPQENPLGAVENSDSDDLDDSDDLLQVLSGDQTTYIPTSRADLGLGAPREEGAV